MNCFCDVRSRIDCFFLAPFTIDVVIAYFLLNNRQRSKHYQHYQQQHYQQQQHITSIDCLTYLYFI